MNLLNTVHVFFNHFREIVTRFPGKGLGIWLCVKRPYGWRRDFLCKNRPGKVLKGSSLLLFLDTSLPLRKDRRSVIVTALGPESYIPYSLGTREHSLTTSSLIVFYTQLCIRLKSKLLTPLFGLRLSDPEELREMEHG